MIDAIATNLSFLPLKFSRNKLSHTIDAADPELTSRVGLKYYLTINIPEYPFSDTFVELHTAEGREKPVEDQSGLQIYAGAEFRYNSGRNGKIDGLLSYTKPLSKQGTMSVIVSQTMPFFLTEYVQGGDPEVDTTNQLAKMYAIKAGIINEDFPGYGDSFWNKYQLGARQFLTWQPNYKRVGAQQEEYLYFLLNFTPKPQTLKLRVQSYNAAGVGSDAATAMSLANPLLYSVICCPVGPLSLEIPETAVRYDVWLSNEDDKRVTEIRSYFVDGYSEVYDRSILFVNSLGGWDTLRLNGQAQRTLKVSQTTAELERPANAPVDFSELKIINIEGEHELMVSTGYFKRDAAAQLKYLDDLLLSEELYLITDKGHRPLKLLSTTMVDEQDNADLVARTFNFRILDTVENFSNLPPNTPESRPVAWRGIDLRYVLDAFGKRSGFVKFSRIYKVYADDETVFKPYTVKPNLDGDPDYLPPIADSTAEPGTTPYPSAGISRQGTLNRANCAVGYVGGPATIVIAAGTFGGENPGDADLLAEAKAISMDTQAYANANGTCVLNNTPVRIALRHEIPMTGGLVTSNGKEGPRVTVFWDGAPESHGPYTGVDPAITQIFASTALPGVRNLGAYVYYGGAEDAPRQACKLVLVGKGREINVTTSSLHVFDSVTVNSTDDPLIIKVTMP